MHKLENVCIYLIKSIYDYEYSYEYIHFAN